MKRKKIYIPTSHLWDHICENICNIIIIYSFLLNFFLHINQLQFS